MEIIVGWLVFAVLVGVVASSRGRGFFTWTLISLPLSPLIGLVLLLLLDKKGIAALPKDEAGRPITPDTHVRCPDCRELVRKDARKCKHCGTALIPQ